MVGIFHAWQVLGIVFLAGSPDHWCYNADLEHLNISDERRKRLSIPLEIKDGMVRYSMCQSYDFNFTGYTEMDVQERLQKLDTFNLTMPVKTKSCNRWKYDPTSRFQETIVTQVNVYAVR